MRPGPGGYGPGMAEFTHTATLPASAERAWEVVRRFGDGSWMGVEMTCDGDGEGAVRTISMGGATIVERCERLDDDARVLGYTIVEGPLPLRDYHSTMTIRPVDDTSCELVWSCTFEPVGDPEQATGVVKMIYEGGAAGLARHLAG